MGNHNYLPVLKSLAFAFTLLGVQASVYAQNGASAQVPFQYLGTYSDQGVPLYMESRKDIIDTLLRQDIATALPEQKAVPQYHPEYLATNSETELRITKEADIWVTFVGEMAGFQNSLGFYTYDLDNPPATPEAIVRKTIIFPNVSAPGSAGGLAPGSKVKIGHFKANTGIGWFLVADGWKNNAVGAGNYILYSNPAFNPESEPADRFHTVLLHDRGRKKLILGFEDTRRDQNSDQDFNDVLFYITASPFEAIQKDKVIAITSSVPVTSAEHAPQATNPASGYVNNTNITDSYNTYTKNTSNSNNITNNSQNINTNVSNANSNNTSNSITNNSNSNNSNSNNTNTNSNNTTIINNTTIVNTGGSNIGGGNSNGSNSDANAQNNSGRPGRNDSNSSGKPTTPASIPTKPVPANPVMSTCSPNGFSESDFTKTCTLIRSKPVEDVRVSTLKQAVRGRLITVDQCTQLLNLLTVAAHRLEMAKYLYDYSCEKNNYFMVSKVLTVASYEREFNSFLEKKTPSAPVAPASSPEPTPVRPSRRYRSSYASIANSPSPRQMPVSSSDTYPSNAFTDIEFESLKSNVKQQSFSDTKITIIQQALRNRSISTAQDIELMNMMSFEQDKLKLAKWLYDFTYDQQNYYKVNATFSFSTSIDELNKYLNTK